jgi:transcriptional regulator with XRE-family HTH domain
MVQNGLNKSGLARVANVSPSAVNGWRKGNRISPHVLKRLSDHFNVDLSGLLTDFKEVQEHADSYKVRDMTNARIDALSISIDKLSERMSAIEQLLIKVLAQKEKS